MARCTASITIAMNITNDWDAQPVLPYQRYKCLGYTASIHINITASITILALKMAGMHSQYYLMDIT